MKVLWRRTHNPRNDYFEMTIALETLGNPVDSRNFIKKEVIFLEKTNH